MTYSPKEGEDAITRDGERARFVLTDGCARMPFMFRSDDGLCWWYDNKGVADCGNTKRDLVGPWKPKKKAKKLKWVKVAKGLTVAGGYDIAKRDVDFELTCFDMESRGSTYLGIFPTKKAAKAAAQEDADKL